jgi:carboxymethylenebutenolidase
MDQRIIDLYDEYTHAPLERRVFLSRLAALAGSLPAALALLPQLEPGAQAAVIAPDDARLVTERVSFPGTTGAVAGYLVRPKADGARPGVVVIHENRGLNAHIEDVTRRLALEGFVALAPDLLSASGGTPADADQAREMIGALAPATARGDAVATVGYLKAFAGVGGRVGAVGFCWGGALVGEMATADGGPRAVVAYYGRPLPPERAAEVRCPLLLHYAGVDERVNAGVPAFEAALRKAGKSFQLHTYEGVQHAFNNDTSEARYNRAAADLAWKRTVAFLHAELAG